MNSPRILVTTGDPAGVGPQLCLDLLLAQATGDSELRDRSDVSLPHARFVVVGDFAASILGPDDRSALVRAGIPVVSTAEAARDCPGSCWWDPHTLAAPPAPGVISAETGRASFGYVVTAMEQLEQGDADAIVTGPIHKHAWQIAGIEYPGHTEFFVERCGAERHAMLLTSPEITCALVTTHVGLAEVSRLLTPDRIVEVIDLTGRFLSELLGRAPRLAVLGLNPHAGEEGRFGHGEEERVISPAIETARSLGWSVDGPLPPDTAFLLERRRCTDAYICMYHDQGLIPLKTLAFDRGVNVTLGLPIIRTSVDHGPALDLAGTHRASTGSLFAACELAVRWFTSRNQSRSSRSDPCPPAVPSRH